ncbi:hypothetical protein K493DRAFT_371047 [Basidiobolus meristosporus CBS 931.73]|uniref:G-protein coupled receptors family 2 profile 2 domain-containing protein n=1 Tax=Basidiobolus meristosporus CBS 931.73 TaxID=1314790 RepID=A0A1Y1YEI9_9FUNG|nr:hypothetical protein K493DRAFT_371047 [Basidiobolus meristosporus CBS 931.73]|eukprot:ORX96422.1 hypothetical protein K493DRAFT_371047 [Basidiobolus meristosporus CBS 931.73]
MSASEEVLFQNNIYDFVFYLLHGSSVISAALVSLTFLGLSWFKGELTESISFRLSIWIAVVDIFYSLFNILNHAFTNPGFLCTSSAWGISFTSLAFVFLSVSLAFNLQATVVHNRLERPEWERIYILASIVLALLLSLIPLPFGVFGYDKKNNICWFISTHKHRAVWETLTFLSWSILGVIYSMVVVAMITERFVRQVRCISALENLSDSHSINVDRSKIINLTALFITFYALVPAITQTFNLLAEFMILDGMKVSFPLLMAAVISSSIQGIVNSVVFALDPTLRLAISEIREDLLRIYFNGKLDIPPEAELFQSIKKRILNFAVERFILKSRSYHKEIEIAVWSGLDGIKAPDRAKIPQKVLSQKQEDFDSIEIHTLEIPAAGVLPTTPLPLRKK